MFIFIRLLAAHLIADFLLQTDRVFKIKVKYKWGVLLHGGIVAFTTAIFLLPYLSNPIIMCLFILGALVHIFQDKAKITYNLQIEKNNLWTFLLDQFGHISVLAIISYGALNLDHPVYPGPEWLDKIYKNDQIMYFAIWFVLITYTTAIMQEYIKKIITGDTKERIMWPTPRQKYLEILERALISLCIFLGNYWYAGAIAAALLGYFLVRAKRSPVLNYQVGTILAVIIGFLMKLTV
ncbi:MAG: DUF3307 domain-containing protein [Candidatus Firestonebacteria bacterium]